MGRDSKSRLDNAERRILENSNISAVEGVRSLDSIEQITELLADGGMLDHRYAVVHSPEVQAPQVDERILRAEACLAEDEHQDSLMLFLEALSDDPDSVRALVGAAKVCLAMGSTDDAYFFYTEAKARPVNDEMLEADMAMLKIEMQSRPRSAADPVPPPATFLAVDDEIFKQHNCELYRVPSDLGVTSEGNVKFLVIGSCLAMGLPGFATHKNREWEADFVLVNNFGDLPDLSDKIDQYAFQLVQVPLRTVMQDIAYCRLPQDDLAKHEEFLALVENYTSRYLEHVLALGKERKLLTYVMGFMPPQQNPMGRLQPRYDIRNMTHFVERMNMFLESELAKYPNTHLVDTDSISATFGRKYIQDDMTWSATHGGVLTNSEYEHDLNRIVPPAPMSHHYELRNQEFGQAVVQEVMAMYRTIKQQDTVKLVCVDLDDTLWRGVAVDGTLDTFEGWPLGLIEALHWLKKRGILLGIVSKNSEEFIVSNWERITGGLISLDDFAVRKINFTPKAQNIIEILELVNLRAANVVMIDDNPVEREAIKESIPGIRVLGSHPYYLKRVLLWSPETQRAVITDESKRKTEMVHRQIKREETRRTLSHDEFLKSLGLDVTIGAVTGGDSSEINRVLELFNKTNQFNTCGIRYTLEEVDRLLRKRVKLYVFHARDRFTSYGLIGAAWVRDACVEHLVMSCRVIGLGVEDAALSHIAKEQTGQGSDALTGVLIETDANLACRQIFAKNGFVQDASDPTHWARSLVNEMSAPEHIALAEAA